MKIIILILFTLAGSIKILSQSYGTWETIDSLNVERVFHASVVLDDGRVLTCGGNVSEEPLKSTEIYDPVRNEWLIAADMNIGRMEHKIVKLQNGTVLAAGGFEESSCEIYDPSADEWRTTDSLLIQRDDEYTLTLLANGDVLITGGVIYDTINAPGFNDCEIFDHISEKWRKVSSLNIGRKRHTANLLPNGKVLVIGGYGISSSGICELYDPANDSWTILPAELDKEKVGHRTLLLNDSELLVVRGSDGSSEVNIFDLSTYSWTKESVLENYMLEEHVYKMGADQVIIFDGYGFSNYFEIIDKTSLETISSSMLPRERLRGESAQLHDSSIIFFGGSFVYGQSIVTTKICDRFIPIVSNIELENATNNSIDFSVNVYPNPFNPQTTFTYSLPEISQVKVEIIDINGSLVRSFEEGIRQRGTYKLLWDGTTSSGVKAASGIYLYRITAVSSETGKLFADSRKMILLK